MQLYEMTREQVELTMAAGATTAVATFGATEQHGSHLPMGTDCIWGDGCSEHHMDFAGSLTLSDETFAAVVIDTCRSVAHHGFERIVLLPTHGGNFKPLAAAATQAQLALPDLHITAITDMAQFLAHSSPLATLVASHHNAPAHTLAKTKRR